jgi:hypothetical protein
MHGENWIDEVLDKEIVLTRLHLNFEEPDLEESKETQRFLKLRAIEDFAKVFNLTYAKSLAKAAQDTNEDILPILAMIGYSFDGKQLHEIDDKISSVPVTFSKEVLVEKKKDEGAN